MNVLIIHHGFPGQYRHIVKYLLLRGDNVTAIGPKQKGISSVEKLEYIGYELSRGNGADTNDLVLETESKVLRGEAVGRVVNKLSASGYSPDIVLSHPGWGECLFVGDVWPDTPQLHYVEFFYKSDNSDLDFDDIHVEPMDWYSRARGKMKNASLLIGLEDMSWGVTPTLFQHKTLPTWAQSKTSIIHDGIDTTFCSPKSVPKLIMNGVAFSAKDKIVTFVNRTFEPYRGVHVFVDAIPKIQKVHPDAKFILVGQDSAKVSYGKNRADGRGWFSALREEYCDSIDWTSIYAVGQIQHSVLRDLFRITSAHVYLTYPFVLSWSLLEAMSCGAMIIGSDTSPVREVIEDGHNGLLTPFGNSQELADRVVFCLNNQKAIAPLRVNARKLIQAKYDLDECVRSHLSLIDAVASRAIAA